MEKKAVLDNVNAYLLKEVEFLVPVKKVWQNVDMGSFDWFEFLEALQNDPRFYLQNEEEIADEKEASALEALGFYSGPRIMLKIRMPSSNELFKRIAQQITTIHDALTRAYKNRPKNDKETEVRIKEAIAKTQELEKGLIKVFEGIKKEQ